MFDITIHYFMQDTERHMAVQDLSILDTLNMPRVSAIQIVANVE